MICKSIETTKTQLLQESIAHNLINVALTITFIAFGQKGK